MEYPLPLERRRELPDLIHQASPGDVRVVGEGLLPDVDLVELHGGREYRRGRGLRGC